MLLLGRSLQDMDTVPLRWWAAQRMVFVVVD